MKFSFCFFFAFIFSFIYGQTPLQERSIFIETAKKYLGAPYVSGGTSMRGMDCSGLVFRAALDGPKKNLPRTVATLSGSAEKISDRAREPGDLLFFNTTGTLSHVGIYLGDDIFIHAASDGPRTGVIMSKLTESYWARTYRHSARVFSPAGTIPQLAQSNSSEEKLSPGLTQGRQSPQGRPFPQGTQVPTGTNEPIEVFPFLGETGFRTHIGASVLWDIQPKKIPIRGASLFTEASWNKGLSVYPGLGAGIAWDSRSSSVSFPVYFSVSTMQGFRFFIGTQFHVIASKTLDRNPQFPGIIGFSWLSSPKTIQNNKIRFYQSIEYSWFPNETSWSGLRLSTGITLAKDW